MKNGAKEFFAKVDSTGGEDSCWRWIGYRNKNGYGAISISGRNYLAHRVMMMYSGNDVPKGRCVLHRCDNPGCVNPKHLFVGTQIDNIVDMRRKGRAVNPPRVNNSGERHGHSKLTDEQVNQILISDLSTTQLAQLYGVSHGTISLIRSGKSWKHIARAK